MRKKRPGTYAALATHYYDDPKIIEAGFIGREGSQWR